MGLRSSAGSHILCILPMQIAASAHMQQADPRFRNRSVQIPCLVTPTWPCFHFPLPTLFTPPPHTPPTCLSPPRCVGTYTCGAAPDQLPPPRPALLWPPQQDKSHAEVLSSVGRNTHGHFFLAHPHHDTPPNILTGKLGLFLE